MSIPVIFNNREIVEPGVYSRVTSGEPTKPTNFPFGTIMLIDTGRFAGWGGGSGISGTLKSGADAIYNFERQQDFKAFIKGGEQFFLSDYLFNPKEGANGPSNVGLCRACETTPAELDETFANARLVLRAKNEGTVSNTLLDETAAFVGFRLLSSTLVVSNTLTFKLKNGATILMSGSLTVASTSLLSNSQLVVDAINNDSSNFSAKLVGTSIVVTAPPGLGATANSYTIVFDGQVTLEPVTGLTTNTRNFAKGVTGTKLLVGLGMILRAGDFDPNKYIVELHQGNFRGKSSTNFYYGELSEKDVKPTLVSVTPEVSTWDEVIQFFINDSNTKKVVEIDETLSAIVPNGLDGVISESDELGQQTDYFKFTGGSETYTPEALDSALEFMREMTNTYFVCDLFGADAISVQNQKILTSVQNDSEFERFLIIGGGKDSTKFEGGSDCSVEIAKHYDTEKVILVHSGAEIIDNVNKYSEQSTALVTAYNVAGLLGGLPPQEPATFKSLRLKNFNHVLSIEERKRALKAGVLHIRNVEGLGNVINQGVNTLQRNTVLWNTDGKSYEISIMNISSQLNKELTLNLRPLFIGHNRGTVTSADVKAAVEAYLLSQTNDETTPRLLVKFTDVKVVRTADQYNITYGFEPNGPINKMFLTGFMLDNIN